MSNLGKRVEQLEQKAVQGSMVIWCIFLVALRAEGEDSDNVTGYSNGTRKWERQEGEKLDALRARVRAEAEVPGRVVMLLECYGEKETS